MEETQVVSGESLKGEWLVEEWQVVSGETLVGIMYI